MPGCWNSPPSAQSRPPPSSRSSSNAAADLAALDAVLAEEPGIVSGVGSIGGAQAAGPRPHRGPVVRDEARDADADRRCARRPRLLQRPSRGTTRAFVPRCREVAGVALAGALQAADIRRAAADGRADPLGPRSAGAAAGSRLIRLPAP